MISIPAAPSFTLLIVGGILLAPMLVLFLIASSIEKREPRKAAVVGWSLVAIFAVALAFLGTGMGFYIGGENARVSAVQQQVERQYRISLTDGQTRELLNKQPVKLNDGSSVQLLFRGDNRAKLRKISYVNVD